MALLLSSGGQVVRAGLRAPTAGRTIDVDSRGLDSLTRDVRGVQSTERRRGGRRARDVVARRHWCRGAQQRRRDRTARRWASPTARTAARPPTRRPCSVANTSATPGTVRATAVFRGRHHRRSSAAATSPPTAAATSTTIIPMAQGRRSRSSSRASGAQARYCKSSSSGRCTRTQATPSGRPAPTPSARRSSRANTFTVTPNGLFPKVLVVDDGEQVTIVEPQSGPGRHHRLRTGRPRHLRRPAPDPWRQPRVRQRTSDAEPVAASPRTS